MRVGVITEIAAKSPQAKVRQASFAPPLNPALPLALAWSNDGYTGLRTNG
jgi:hypothetical protein